MGVCVHGFMGVWVYPPGLGSFSSELDPLIRVYQNFARCRNDVFGLGSGLDV